MVWDRIIRWAGLFLWLFINLLWMSEDTLLRDGDEEGHVGAMELFKDLWLEQGFQRWFTEVWQGNYGEYPPLFAGIMGGWWGLLTYFVGSIPPNHLLVRGMLLLFPLLTGWAIQKIAKSQGWNDSVALFSILSMPLLIGVSRHFMPEAMMMTFSTLSIASAVYWSLSPSWKRAVLTGILFGLGLLAKQTMIIVAPMVLISIFWKNPDWRSALLFLLSTLFVAGPWYVQHLFAQFQYLSQSAENSTHPDLFWRIFFYPSTLLYAIGILTPLFLLALLKGIQKIPLPLWIWNWMGSMLLLMLIPKQYPRLLLAWLPVVGLFLSMLATQNPFTHLTMRDNRNTYLLIFIGFTTLLLHSFSPIQPILQEKYSQFIQSNMDDGCSQVWIRNPSKEDGHLEEIYQHLKQHPIAHQIAFIGDPEIPCTLQTTHPWNTHIEPYFRRRGLDVTAIQSESIHSPVWQDADIQIIWKGDTIVEPMELQIQR